MILYINSCVRGESRTDRLARAVLDKMGKYTELYLPDEDIKPLTEETLGQRTELLASNDLNDPMFYYAHQFANAEKIVISAPFWDGSFPSLLKVYIENIYAVGIVSRYDEKGMPVGMCKAQELVYVTTAGGKYIPDFSYDYIKAIAENYFGIKNTRLVMAEMLDIEGFDAEKILQEAIAGI
ncbi:MAG: NAD(P)H-dependent oxidoreductase [Ruminococcus sp.]|nr:NAD(P)H-dependent oxidoreductase [Ruminococcus sp.]MBR1752996.1 NAD(P)H-dependent oxidoreductase [Ruminococcus sp.]